MSRSEAYLRHILDAIEKIERYVKVGHHEFMETSHWQDAVIRQLEIIGEAVKRLSPEEQQARPDIPWRAIAGMRDVLIHNYMGVDLEAVWQVTSTTCQGYGARSRSSWQEIRPWPASRPITAGWRRAAPRPRAAAPASPRSAAWR